MPVIDEHLADAGLSLQGVLATQSLKELPDEVRDYASLMVFAHVGPMLWESMVRSDIPDPLDTHALELVRAFLRRTGVNDYMVLYPFARNDINLMAIGQKLGWQHPGFLGIGINQLAGTWFAYRVVVAVNADLPATDPLPGVSPCNTCADRPCISACPSGAVRTSGNFDLATCSSYRLMPDSLCADTCLARNACPVGEQHRYGEDQMHYHYSNSLQAIRLYSKGGS